MRSPVLLFLAVLGLSTFSLAQTRQPDPVALAVLPLPDTLRAKATVVQYEDGVRALLRRGTNGLTCVADQPNDLRLSLVCYPTSIDPYMDRRRELRAEGLRGAEFRAILGAEVRTGQLYLPTGVMIRNVSGPINPDSGVPDSVRVWSEMFVPFADAGELGIPEFDAGLDPWMMSAGTVGAHVMVRYRSVRWDEVW